MEPKRFKILIKCDGKTTNIPKFEALTIEDAIRAVGEQNPGCEILKCELVDD